MARTKAAKPAALEARPAAVGKLLRDTILSGYDESGGRDESLFSTSVRNVLSSRRQAWVRAPEMSCSLALRISESAVKDGLQEAVVCVRRSSCESVTERDELVGRLRVASRLPQYLYCCIRNVPGRVRTMSNFVEASVKGNALDDSNVHRRKGAGSVDFLVCHDWSFQECVEGYRTARCSFRGRRCLYL